MFPDKASVNVFFCASMALDAASSTSFARDQFTNPWQLSSFPEFENMSESNFPDFSIHEPDKIHSDSLSPTLLPALIPQYVQPHDTHKSSSPTESVGSAHSTPPSLDSLSRLVSLERQQTLRCLSLASTDMNDHSYRPRKTPARRPKATIGRITPRSNKHARELELNRKAATKCRNRQKSFVENLQKKCWDEEQKMHEQSALVHALHDEVVSLRNEVMRRSFCACQSLRRVKPALLV